MGRVISVSLVAMDNMSRAFDASSRATLKLHKNLSKLETVGKGVGLVTAAAGAVALTKAAAPAAAAIAAIPAAMVAAKVATTTFKVGIQGVGEAMKAAAEGDAKKLEEALKDLTPAARSFVKETQGLKDAFKPVQQAVQQRLFSGLGRDIKGLSGSMPMLKTGMTGVAGALNGIAREAIKTAKTGWFQSAMAGSMKMTATALNQVKGAVEPLMRVIAGLVKLGAPLFQRMTGWAVSGIKAADAFMRTKDGAAKMSALVKQSGDTLAQLGRIVRNTVSALLSIVNQSDAFNTSGQNMLTTIEGLTIKFNAWATSAEGQKQAAETFRLLGDVLRQIVQVLPLVLGPLGLVVKALDTMPGPVREGIVQLLAMSVTVGLIVNKLKLLYIAVALFKGGKMLFDFARGFTSIARGAAQGASAAARFGAALRLNASIMLSSARASVVAAAGFVKMKVAAAGNWIMAQATALRALAAAQLANARAATVAAIALVRQKVAMIATKVAAVAMRVATLAWSAAQWVLNAALTANPIGLIIAAIALLVGAFVLAYKKVDWFRKGVDAAWAGIKAATKLAWNFVIKPVFEAIKFFITKIVIPYYKLLWTIVKAVWNGIVTVSKWAWERVIKPIWNLIKWYIQNVLIRQFNLLKSGATTVFNAVASVIKNVYNNHIRPTFDRLKQAVGLVKTAFGNAVKGIEIVWNKLKDAAKKPVNFVIGIYNNGIKPLVENIGKLVGLHPNLPRVPTFATGGIYPGYTPGRDIGLAAVSGGEAIMRPEFTKAVGPDFVHQANSVARKSGPGGVRKWIGKLGGEGMAFSRGGVVPGFAGNFGFGGIVDGFVKGLKDFAFGNVGKAAKKMLDKLMGIVPGSGGFRNLVAGIPDWIKSKVLKWVTMNAGDGVGGPGMRRALTWAKGQAGKPYSWGGVGPGGYDCSGFMSAIHNVIKGRSPYSRLYSTHSFGATSGPGGFVRNLNSGFTVGVTDAGVGHMAGTLLKKNVESSGSAGVRVGGGARGTNDGMFTRRYGLKADTGAAILDPGFNVMYNGTGRPELLTTPHPGGSGNQYTINVNVAPGGDLAKTGKMIVDAITEYERRSGRRWRS